MPEIVLALTTVPTGFDVRALARTLIEKRLAACVTILPGVHSMYTWEGAIEESAEQQVVLKTTRERVAELWPELKARHPYEVPEFVVLTVGGGNPDYLQWVSGSTGSSDRLP